MHRNQRQSAWKYKAAAFLFATTLSGVAVGALLGSLGSVLGPDVRAIVGTLGALVAVLVSVIENSGRRVPLPQRNRETPQPWLESGSVRWALVNGVTLGAGFASRIGFWLWYVVPLGAFLSGNVVIGAVLFGLYGFGRGLSAILLILGTNVIFARGGDRFPEIARRVVGEFQHARSMSTIALLFAAAVALTGARY